MTSGIRRNDRHGTSRTVCATAVCALLAIGLVSGCASTNPRREPSGPPAAWVQPSTPFSPAAVQYERRMPPPTPVQQLPMPVSAPFELTPSEMVGPEFPAPVAPTTPSLSSPPMAPAAELFGPPDAPSSVPSTADPFSAPTAAPQSVKQPMLDELSSQLAALDERLNEQAAAMEAARRQSEADREATVRLQTEFRNWQAELDVVRDTLREQSAADVEALDQLNEALNTLLQLPASPGGQPEHAEPPRTATGRSSERGTR